MCEGKEYNELQTQKEDGSADNFELSYHIMVLEHVVYEYFVRNSTYTHEKKLQSAHIQIFGQLQVDIKTELLIFFPNVIVTMIFSYLTIECSGCYLSRFFHSSFTHRSWDMIECSGCKRWFCLDTGCALEHKRHRACQVCGDTLYCGRKCLRCTTVEPQKKRRKLMKP